MQNEKDLINEIKEIMKECAHFAKTGSCYGCSDVKCVHGRYIGLILTGLAAAKAEHLQRANEVEGAMFELMGLAGKPFDEGVVLTEEAAEAVSMMPPDTLLPGNLTKHFRKTVRKIAKDAAVTGQGNAFIDFKSGKTVIERIAPKKYRHPKKVSIIAQTPPCRHFTDEYNGLSRQEMKECIQMASGEYNSFNFKKATLPEIYEIYEKECGA